MTGSPIESAMSVGSRACQHPFNNPALLLPLLHLIAIIPYLLAHPTIIGGIWISKCASDLAYLQLLVTRMELHRFGPEHTVVA